MWPGPHGQHRRTELFRSDALRRFGFVVHETVYSQVALPRFMLLVFSWQYPLQLSLLSLPFQQPLPKLLNEMGIEFIVMAKPSIDFLRQTAIQTKGKIPLYIWTWDLIDYPEDPSRRTWFQEAIGFPPTHACLLRGCVRKPHHAALNAGVTGLVDGAFLNEIGRENMWRQYGGGGVHHVNDGTVAISNRGPGRVAFPFFCSSDGGRGGDLEREDGWDTGGDVVFVGGVQGHDSWRVAPIRALLNAGIDVRVYGPEIPWQKVSAPRIWLYTITHKNTHAPTLTLSHFLVKHMNMCR